MKKTLIGIMIAFWVIVFVLIGIVAYSAISGNEIIPGTGNIFDFGSEKVKTQEIPAAPITEIIVEANSMGIKFIEAEGDDIVVTQFGKKSTAPENLFTYTVENGVLHIDAKRKGEFFGLNFASENLFIELPLRFNGKVFANALSGGIEFDDEFRFTRLEARTNSGGIRIDDKISASEDILLRATSGGIRVNGEMIAKTATVNTNSGGISIEAIFADDFEINATSGGISIGALGGGGSIKTTSGSIRAEIEKIGGDIYINAVSGGIRLSADDDISFKFEGKTTSGNISADFALDFADKEKNRASGTYGNAPVHTIHASTSSGGISVEKD